MNSDGLTIGERWEIQALEHEAWVRFAQAMREAGLDLNVVDVATFEPARRLLNEWALTYARGHEAGVFTS